MWSDVFEEHVASIFRVKNQLNRKPTCSRWLGKINCQPGYKPYRVKRVRGRGVVSSFHWPAAFPQLAPRANWCEASIGYECVRAILRKRICAGGWGNVRGVVWEDRYISTPVYFLLVCYLCYGHTCLLKPALLHFSCLPHTPVSQTGPCTLIPSACFPLVREPGEEEQQANEVRRNPLPRMFYPYD
jgi:hypothetical protein